ncbi:MAG TPA: AMP-binding protein [Candidatus Binataceae bacterium]|nr:AMP-binding protein [Candidatus Binataceae bacterium]
MARVQGAIERLIRSRAGQHPKEVWLKFKDQQFTWEQVIANMNRAANGLLELGVRPGERVAIMMGNRPEFIWLHFGIGFIGAVSVPINTSQRGATLHHILADSDSTAVIFEEPLRSAVLAVKDSVPALRHTVVADGAAGNGVDWTMERLLSHSDRDPELDVGQNAGGGGMMYTSGTTGPPKGVVAKAADGHSLAAVLAATGVKPGETMYTALPLFHGNALMISGFGSMVLDAKFALGERFSASRFWDDCRKFDAVEFNSLGGMLSIILKQPPRPNDRDHRVRVVLSAACPPNAWKEFEDRFGVKIVEFYGMVDSPGLLLNDTGKVGSMGKPVGGVEFRVVDDNDNPVPADKTGELVFRHPLGQLSQYHKLPDATAEAYRGGWFHSGDLAAIDKDGFFYFRGRKKASIRRRGENISAWEIETVVNQHPAVLESAAYAVPSELGEDEVKIAVVLKDGGNLDPAEMIEFCRGRMAYYAVPRYIEIVNELPKTGTQRIQYAALKERGIGNAWDREKAGITIARA